MDPEQVDFRLQLNHEESTLTGDLFRDPPPDPRGGCRRSPRWPDTVCLSC